MKPKSFMTRRTDSLSSALVLLAIVGLILVVPAGAAQAQTSTSTVVLNPTGAVKARYLERVKRSLGKSIAKLDGVSMASKDAGKVTGEKSASCAVSVACLAKAGAALGGTRALGVLLEAKGSNFELTFLLVDVGASEEILRATVDLKHRDLRGGPGTLLEDFLAGVIDDGASAATEDDLGPASAPEDDLGPASAPEDDLGPASGPEDDLGPASGPEDDLDAAPATVEATATAEVGSAGQPDSRAVDPLVVAPSPPSGANTAATVKKIHVGVQAGVFFPQLQSELGTAPSVEVEGGYVVWRNLAPYLSIGYTQPKVSDDLDDPRLPAGDYSTSSTQRELTMTVGALWRLFGSGAQLNAYGGLGARIWLLETITNGEAGGSSFLENRETSTRFGAAVIGGAEYALGPGSAVFEVDFGGSNLPHLITGDVATTAISTSLGYRLMF